MIKVVKNHFHNHEQVIFDRLAVYDSREGLENDIWNMSNYIENMIGHVPEVVHSGNIIMIGSSNDDVHAVWHFYNVD